MIATEFQQPAIDSIIDMQLEFNVIKKINSDPDRFSVYPAEASPYQAGVYIFEIDLTDKEILEISKTGSIYVYQLNLGNLITPYLLSVTKEIILQ